MDKEYLKRNVDTVKPAAKLACNITWEESETNSKLEEIIKNGIATICDMLGSDEVDFENDIRSRELLINYIVYKWNNVSEQFRTNYISDILECRKKVQLEKFVPEGDS